jgi:hypothetical protein
MPIHPFAQASLAILRNKARLVVLRDEVVQVVVCFQNDVAASTAIASAWPTLRPILLTLKCHAAFAAVARP